MTCNPMWKEIQDNLEYQEKSQDRPDLLVRIFRARFEILKNELLKKQVFGEVAACVYVIEFQKRGFPHAHLLLILKPQSKLLNPQSYDKIVCAEIPQENGYLYSLVVKHMIHGPCGNMNKHCPCMKSGICKNHYPKNFSDYTVHGEDTYPYYRRRNNGKMIRVQGYNLDNRWVVPYNPYLLALLNCHINVEICSTVKLVKYLYKYVFKGHDLVSFQIVDEGFLDDIDEIKQFQQARWISPPEDLWRIYKFRLNEMTPAVYTLQVHLPDHQLVSFNNGSNLTYLLRNVDFSTTMLIEFFRMNTNNEKARQLKCLYKEFLEHFVWNPRIKAWSERKRQMVIGRLVTVSPKEGERYYLRLLLTHIRAPASFDDLLTIQGEKTHSYREAALRLGLLRYDQYIEETLSEAVLFQMPSSFRLLFATVLCYCSLIDPSSLWEKFKSDLSADYNHAVKLGQLNSYEVNRTVLFDLNRLFYSMGKSLADYQIENDPNEFHYQQQLTSEADTEASIQIDPDDLLLSSRLNPDKKYAFDLILDAVFANGSQSFFIDGLGGTGNSFLYRSLLATLRAKGYVAIAVATSGVVASILPGGRTAHSRFKIPLDFSKVKTCQLSKQSCVARLIIQSRLILWDEASMAKRQSIETLNDLLKDLMDCEMPFGGKVVVFGGDFRQTLPVIEQASKQVLIDSSLLNSPLWKDMYKLASKQNMRALSDPQFCDFLLRIGEGKEPTDVNGDVTLPSNIVIPYTDRNESLDRLIHYVFHDMALYSDDPSEMINRCILAPKNTSVHELNELIIERFLGDLHTYIASNRTVDERHQGDYEDFLNSQNPRGLLPFRLSLKKNCPVMLFRNLNPTEGLCNGTRLICKELGRYSISAEIACGQYTGKTVFIPKIPLQTSDNERNGIPFIRTQFPVRLCFAMTINKSQGQTLDYVGIYIREPVFSHGQLYVALSRARSADAIKVLIVPGTFASVKLDRKTRNVVFTEIFALADL